MMPTIYLILKISEDLGNENTYSFFPQYDEDVGGATGNTKIREDFMSNLGRIPQLTGNHLLLSSML